jgi:hypothetical protein
MNKYDWASIGAIAVGAGDFLASEQGEKMLQAFAAATWAERIHYGAAIFLGCVALLIQRANPGNNATSIPPTPPTFER